MTSIDEIRERCKAAQNGELYANGYSFAYHYARDIPSLLDELERLKLTVYGQENIIQSLKEEKLPFPWMREYMDPIKARDKALKLEKEKGQLLAEVERLTQGIKEIGVECARRHDENQQLQDDINESLGGAWTDGALYAMYEVCKEADIRSQDIRDSDDTIDGKCARIAERLRAENEALRREREAAIFYLRTNRECETCKDGDAAEAWASDQRRPLPDTCRKCADGEHWRWRDSQDEAQDGEGAEE